MAEKELSKEEIEKLVELRKQEWDGFVKKLKDNPEATITNAELNKVIDFISEDIEGIMQMVQVLTHNMNVLGHNFNQLVKAIQGGGSGPAVNKTKSGLILP